MPLAFSHGASCGVQFYIGRKRFANLPLVSQILFSNNGVRRMTTTRQFDGINRLTQIANTGETGSTRVYLDRTAVAQIASLPYRGLPIRDRTKKCTISRLPVGDAAGCQPAPPACRTRGAVVPAKCARSTLSSSMGGSFWPYQYDAPDWRTRQMTSDGSSGTWVLTEDLKFVSEPLLFGRHAMDLNASNNVAVRTYVWGLDLPETLEGAGGVRGLLWVTLHTGSGPAAGTHFAAYDGNGNVVALLAASDGLETARYEYGPFGEQIRVSGPAAPLNPFRFLTKRTCNTTELVLYEYRAYSPRLGKWANRDPIEEAGGENLYGFGYNNPMYYVDALGLADLKYSSEGKAYVDAHRPHFYYIDRIVDESGKRSSPVSYFFQMVRQKNPCPGGICNSGGTGDSSSFVVATVKNVSKCSLEVECRCSISYASVTFAPQKVGGFLVKGHVLGEAFRKAFTPVSDDQRPGWFIAAGAGSISRTQTFVLSSGASKELYRGITVTALPPNMVGSGFIESMNGACTCTSK